jgi:quercetin dioxygenase-like cupin family protein
MNRALVRGAALALVAAGIAALAHEQDSAEYESGVKEILLLSTETTALGMPIEYPQTSKPQVTALKVELAPGKQTGWHTHPYPTYGYILSGELTVQVQGGKWLHYTAGDAFVEIVNTPHKGINMGVEAVRALVFFTGEAGRPNVVSADGR